MPAASVITRDRVAEPGEKDYAGPHTIGGRGAGVVGIPMNEGRVAVQDLLETLATTDVSGLRDLTTRGGTAMLHKQGMRESLGLQRGTLPALQATAPGQNLMTINVPLVQSDAAWSNLLLMLMLADGPVILRLEDDTAVCDSSDDYFNTKEFLAEIWEVVDSRPMDIVCVCKGPIRGNYNIFPAISTLVLATESATFGFPNHTVHALCDPVRTALSSKRVDALVVRRLTLVGDTVDAREAQRFHLVDFVGDDEAVENEVARIVFETCSPMVTNYMYKADAIRAMEEKEMQEADKRD